MNEGDEMQMSDADWARLNERGAVTARNYAEQSPAAQHGQGPFRDLSAAPGNQEYRKTFDKAGRFSGYEPVEQQKTYHLSPTGFPNGTCG